jgi:L-asparagine oxygenase
MSNEYFIDNLTKNKYNNDIDEYFSLQKETLDFSNKFIENSKTIAQKHLKLDFYKIDNQIKHEEGFVVFRNLPLDNCLPETPTNGLRPQSKEQTSEAVILGIIRALNYSPFSYLQEKNGDLIQEISPIQKKESTKSSNGRVELDYHTDAAFLKRKIRPNVLALYCLKNECKTPTQIVQIRSILEHLTDFEVHELMKKNFVFSPPSTFTNVAPCKVAVLYKHFDKIEITISSYNVKATSVSANNALVKLREIAKKHSVAIHARSGDLIVFNNLRCLHGRGAIKSNRWLQRVYGSAHLDSGQVLNLNIN